MGMIVGQVAAVQQLMVVQDLVRFAFCKKTETLREAARRGALDRFPIPPEERRNRTISSITGKAMERANAAQLKRIIAASIRTQ